MEPLLVSLAGTGSSGHRDQWAPLEGFWLLVSQIKILDRDMQLGAEAGMGYYKNYIFLKKGVNRNGEKV